MTVLETIAMARTDGEGAASLYIKEFGLKDAKAYASHLMRDNPNPSPAMFGYIDGFANVVASA